MNPRHLALSTLLLAGIGQSALAIPLLDGFGGTRGYGELAMLRNDDGSSSQLALPFTLKFFDNEYSSFFVNNNGNVTFNRALGTYTPSPFPIASQPMIAPYWADVDTRGVPGGPPDSNNVWIAAPDANTVVVTWDQVGYYGGHTDKIDDFQLVLRNRPDTGAGNFDADFRYNILQWTTGDASGGIGGLGGTPAQAGFDAGNVTDFFTLPGSFTNNVLQLVNSSNVSAATPGLWTFAFRNGGTPPNGSSASNPLLPVATDEGFEFDFGIVLNQQIFIDPIVAIGYDYQVDPGSPLFASVLLPNIGNNLYDLLLWDGTMWVDDQVIAGGAEHMFAAGGIDRFRILGIEPSANLDPENTAAFVTGLTFASAGSVSMSMTPIRFDTDPNDVPAPGGFALLAAAAALGFARKRVRQAA